MPLGKTLSNLRKNSGMTQSELGERLNISAQAISKWENDASEPDIATLKKLADIYGVAITEIIDPNNVSGDEKNDITDTRGSGSMFDTLRDVYLTEIDPVNKIKTIFYLMNILGIGVAEAKQGVESLPYLISGNVDPEESERIKNCLAMVGATVVSERASGAHIYRKIVSTDPPAEPEETHDMRRRFIIANLTAGIPAIVVIIITLMMASGFGDVLLSIYFGACTYSLIFLLWYPTLTRKLLAPVRGLKFEGFLGSIIDLVLIILFIPWIVIVGLISPINYAFSIKTRIQRMKEEDDEDDIFNLEYFSNL